MKYIAHRGAHQKFPENTMEAFNEAVQLGFDGVECDVRRCLTGELIIMHDRKLDRTTDGVGSVADTSYENIKKLRVGNKYLLPTVQAVIEQVVPKTWVNFELKDADSSIIKQIADMLPPKYLSHVLISSKQPAALRDEASGLQRAAIHPIAALAMRRARQLNTKSIVTRSWRINRLWWHRAAVSSEINVYLYVVRSKLESDVAQKNRVAGIMCDIAL